MRVLSSMPHRGLLLCALFLGAPPASSLVRNACAADVSRFRGEAFAPAVQVQEMPEGWKELPVRYDPAHEDADLVVVLNQQFYDIMVTPIERYAAENGVNIAVEKGTCGISASRLAEKKADIGSYCCPPAESDRLPGLVFHTFGIHPISLLVHASNPVTGVTLEEARAILGGRLRRWNEVGGPDQLIQTVGRLHCKKRPGHWRLILDNEDLFSSTMKTVGGVEDMFEVIAVTPWSIGWEVHWLTSRYAENVKGLRINGISPGDFASLRSGRYPFYRTLFLTTWEGEGESSRLARALIGHLEGEVERVARQYTIVPKSELVKAGWKFRGGELVGEPEVLPD